MERFVTTLWYVLIRKELRSCLLEAEENAKARYEYLKSLGELYAPKKTEE